ncbi:MAG TPA: hypothetical protein VFU12_11900 [Glycomyces sp.]|nr:hypothetical protein [Glycomyces sp.]
MIRNVTDRIASRNRPAYKGRHRRTRVGAAPAPLPERGEAAESRREAEPVVAAPLAPCA